jgi:hypothetical protein
MLNNEASEFITYAFPMFFLGRGLPNGYVGDQDPVVIRSRGMPVWTTACVLTATCARTQWAGSHSWTLQNRMHTKGTMAFCSCCAQYQRAFSRIKECEIYSQCLPS